MKEQTKFILLFIISILLFGIMLTVYIVEGKISFLVFTIIALVAAVGSLISYSMERNEPKVYYGKAKYKRKK